MTSTSQTSNIRQRGIVIRDRSLLSFATEWARFNSPPFFFPSFNSVYNMAERENSKKRKIRETGKVSGLEMNVWFNDTVSRVPPRSLRRSFCRTLFSSPPLFRNEFHYEARLPRQCCENPNRNWVVYESRVENFPRSGKVDSFI